MLISGQSSRLKTRSNRGGDRTSWRSYVRASEIPQEATALTSGRHDMGDGEVWMDHLRLEEVKWQARLAP